MTPTPAHAQGDRRRSGAIRGMRARARFAHLPLALLGWLVTGILAVAAQADPLAATQAALARFRGESPLRASVELQVRSREDEDSALRQGALELRAEESAAGLRVFYPRVLLERLEAEEASPDAKSPQLGASELLQDVGAAALHEMLNFAHPLRKLLEGGSLVASGSDGKEEPGKLMIRALTPDPDETPYLKDAELLVTLWLAGNGIPEAVETDRTVEAGRFFIHVTTHHRVRRELEQLGDRLVVTRSESRLDVSGLGQAFVKEVDLRLRVVRGEP